MPRPDHIEEALWAKVTGALGYDPYEPIMIEDTAFEFYSDKRWELQDFLPDRGLARVEFETGDECGTVVTHQRPRLGQCGAPVWGSIRGSLATNWQNNSDFNTTTNTSEERRRNPERCDVKAYTC